MLDFVDGKLLDLGYRCRAYGDACTDIQLASEMYNIINNVLGYNITTTFDLKVGAIIMRYANGGYLQ